MAFPHPRVTLRSATLLLAVLLPAASTPRCGAQNQMRVVEILADHDSLFKIGKQVSPTLTFKAGEEVRFRITARKAKTLNRNGSIHGFALTRKKDGAKFPDWDLELKPGVQEFVLKVPSEPGEYQIVCTVICSEGHEDMHMKVMVVV
jgi:heme/copper-type cytochrome/quinol oxidase subunit 2